MTEFIELQGILYKVVERRSSIEPTALQEIKDIFRRIQSGELKHNQEYFHSDCRTSHCIAGWKVALDAEKHNVKLDYEPDEDTDFDGYGLADYSMGQFVKAVGIDPEQLENMDFESDYAKKSWGLTGEESWRLFNGNATIEEQLKLLELLERDMTIECC